ncbi:hypothetical protein [Streptomyces chartreusis]|uniref:hypothetical protein n=1 Tax=Streptomyces chartreusis TaxID=1969 RepID=UPI0033AFFCEE
MTGEADGDTGWLASQYGRKYGRGEVRVRSRATGPGESCAEAFLRYPHPQDVPVQQEHARTCGVDLSQWHNVAVEWTPDHLRGFIDGQEWFRFSGGANADRDRVQCAPSMHRTIQLDNFHGDGLQSAVYDLPDHEGAS